MARRGVTGLSALPASPGSSLTSCLNLCFPAGPFALAQVPAVGLAVSRLGFSQSPAADPVCCWRVTSFLLPAPPQPEWDFHLLSPNGEVSCPPPVVGVWSSSQGRDPVFLHQKAKLNSKAIVSTALLWLELPGAAAQPGTPKDTSRWNCGAPPCFLPVRKVKGLKKRSRSSFFGLFV